MRLDRFLSETGAASRSEATKLIRASKVTVNGAVVRDAACHIDPETGLSKSSRNDLLGYSRTLSCGEILVSMLPHYVKDGWESASADTLKAQGVETVYCENREIFASDSGVTFVNLYKDDKVTYKKH